MDIYIDIGIVLLFCIVIVVTWLGHDRFICLDLNSLQINPQRAGTELSRFNLVNIIAADA